jgi:hypothetical protein
MSMIGKVRRMHFRQGKSVREIARLTSLSRNTIRSWLREPEAKERRYRRPPVSTQLTPFAERLRQALSTDAHRPKRERRTALALFQVLQADGYGGCYSRVTDFVRAWRAGAFVPLAFELGEAYQFDWSEEGMVVGGIFYRAAGGAPEAVCQPGLLAGGLSQPGPRNAVRCPHAQPSRRWAAYRGAASTTT